MSDPLPLFPLENVVLLPGGSVPLHIFEPRYRQMVEDALAGSRRIGMIAVRPEHAAAMAGEPPLFEIGCAGFVAEHQRLPDGRFHLLLRATRRFRVVRELPRDARRLYRLADVAELAEHVGDRVRAEAARRHAVELLVQLAARSPRRMDIDAAGLLELELEAFVAGVAQAVALPAREKQSLLETDTLDERLERLAGALDFYLAAGPPSGPETVH